jgi:hypothetical protein
MSTGSVSDRAPSTRCSLASFAASISILFSVRRGPLGLRGLIVSSRVQKQLSIYLYSTM